MPQRIQWDSTNTMTKRDRYGQASGSDCESLLAETGSSQGRDGSEHGGNPPGGHAGHGHAKGRKSLGKRIGKWVERVVEGVKEKVKGLKKDSA